MSATRGADDLSSCPQAKDGSPLPTEGKTTA
jgi:hypothetical protein